ncbi:MAG: hypothetical protein IJS26_05695 [Alphaproteobacteria bacterium]|nr:hypothetical protein [Alphaproteobacteria bacterium]
MVKLITLKDKIKYRIRKSKENTFLVRDFMDLSDRDQVLRALRALMKENEIIRVGKGVYTKAKKSFITGDYIPKDNLRAIAVTALKKLGVKVMPINEEKNYNERLTEQVPNEFIIGVNKRVSRNISFRQARIEYETL